jgi:iron only hydrogenase large subunit-like protein
MRQQTIYTIRANCHNCYRCVRECPVNAIRISDGQAQVEDDLCIKCGTCVRECPQHAKTVRSDLAEARALISSGRSVAVSLAPSFAAKYPKELAGRVPDALRQLGFQIVGETAEGAKYVTDRSFEEPQTGSICTACPAVVNYVEKYRHEYLDALIPVVSPMIAHGRMIKEKHPDVAVIFIGPCAAKKQEIRNLKNAGIIDVALTFEELSEWFELENIQVENCAESDFDQYHEIGDARLFPILGGMLKTGGIESDGTQADVLHVSGALDVMGLFLDEPDFKDKLIEPLFCKGGCIGGPCFGGGGNSMFALRESIIRYAKEAGESETAQPAQGISYQADFLWDEQKREEISDEQIQKIFERTGKTDPINQLNCGACGYKSCLENAVAVAQDMAEIEMCIPYMRRLAHQRTDRIIDTMPNGIVILDSELCIVKMNPAFQKMFMCNNGILGRRISYLVNADGFERLQSGSAEQHESIQSKYGIKYHEILYTLPDDRQYVGIYSDISKVTYDSAQLDTIKTQTVLHAKEFLDHQVRFAQEMAHYLGKSTAQSEEIARRLIGLYEEEGGEPVK